MSSRTLPLSILYFWQNWVTDRYSIDKNRLS
nr:MAG TPA: hypothetical protein [Caudoviricetes sp.]